MAMLVSRIMYNPGKGRKVEIFKIFDEEDLADTGILLIDGKADFIKNLKKTKSYDVWMMFKQYLPNGEKNEEHPRDYVTLPLVHDVPERLVDGCSLTDE